MKPCSSPGPPLICISVSARSLPLTWYPTNATGPSWGNNGGQECGELNGQVGGPRPPAAIDDGVGRSGGRQLKPRRMGPGAGVGGKRDWRVWAVRHVGVRAPSSGIGDRFNGQAGASLADTEVIS